MSSRRLDVYQSAVRSLPPASEIAAALPAPGIASGGETAAGVLDPSVKAALE
jgi:hypothetical protein